MHPHPPVQGPLLMRLKDAEHGLAGEFPARIHGADDLVAHEAPPRETINICCCHVVNNLLTKSIYNASTRKWPRYQFIKGLCRQVIQ